MNLLIDVEESVGDVILDERVITFYSFVIFDETPVVARIGQNLLKGTYSFPKELD